MSSNQVSTNCEENHVVYTAYYKFALELIEVLINIKDELQLIKETQRRNSKKKKKMSTCHNLILQIKISYSSSPAHIIVFSTMKAPQYID